MKILSKLNNTGMIEETADKRYVTDAEKLKWNNKTDKTYVDNQDALKADKTYVDNKVKTDVPVGAKFTDTVYTHPATHPASMITDLPTGKKVARFVVGTSTTGWTTDDCDYLCDGTDDQTEINAAINDLPATGGEIVILDGTYNITATIDVTKDNVSIRGNGNATILKRMYDGEGSQGVITLTNRSGCKITNLQIEGNKTTYTRTINYNIYLENSSNNTITGNTYNNSVWGIYLEGSSNNTVINNTCNDNSMSGISLEASNDNIVTGNTSNNAEIGIYLESSNDNTITGNTCDSNSGGGIYLESSNDNTVTGNTCNNNSLGIALGSSNNTITGNTCNNNSVGIGLYYSSSNNAATGNTCHNNDYGIYLESANDNTVTGNTCNNNNYGIYVEYSSNNTVIGNTCVRGAGLAADYTGSQHTILLRWAGNNYNLISNNNCMGKAPVIEGGTGNSVYGNKYDSGDYKDFTQDEKTKLAGIAANANNYVHPTTAGNKHIPAGGASGQVLKYSASGTATWQADNDTITTINGKTGAISKADIVALGIPSQDTNTTYSEITTAEIDDGTSSTLRTISGRRVKYILDKVQGWIGGLTKSDVGLSNVDNTSDASKPISTATQAALDGKVNNSQVLTNVPSGAKFTDTITTINGKTGAISKADITALGIPAQDTVYSHPSSHPASMITESSTKRFVSDTEKANWNNKWDYNESTIKAVKVSSAGHADNADNASKLGQFDAEYYATMPYLQDVHDSIQTSLDNKVNNSRVLTDVPANANFSNTTYSEISTAEIDAGTASTLRTITARRLKYLSDKFAPSSHTHTWAQVTGQPAQATRWPTWSEVTSKPTTATRWPTWSEVTSKPSTFAPSSHTHAWSEVTSKPTTATRWPTWSEVTGKPSTFAPSTHTHNRSATTLRGAVNVAASTNYTVSQSIRNFDLIVVNCSTNYGTSGAYNFDIWVFDPATISINATGVTSVGQVASGRSINFQWQNATTLRVFSLTNTLSPRIISIIGIKFTA